MKKLLTLFFLLTAIILKADYWTQKANFPGAARHAAFSFSIGNQGYAGCGSDGTNSYTDFWEYNPVSNAWTQKANFGGTARTFSVGFSIGNKGYSGLGIFGNLIDFWEYDPSLNNWVQKANFPGNFLSRVVGFNINGKGYTCTGESQWPNQTQELYEYDPISDVWTQKTSFSGDARTGAVGFVVNNNAYVGTGVNSIGFYADFWKYNPLTNAWAQIADLPGNPRSAAVSFSINNKGFVGTGIGYSDFYEYNDLSNTWTQKTSLPINGGRSLSSGFTLGSKGYVCLGNTNGMGTYLNDLWEYSPDSATSINEVNQPKFAAEIFPNPFFSILNISTKHSDTLEIILYNLSSKKLLQQKFTNSVSLNTEKLAKGLYLYEVRSKEGSCKKGKVVKH